MPQTPGNTAPGGGTTVGAPAPAPGAPGIPGVTPGIPGPVQAPQFSPAQVSQMISPPALPGDLGAPGVAPGVATNPYPGTIEIGDARPPRTTGTVGGGMTPDLSGINTLTGLLAAQQPQTRQATMPGVWTGSGYSR
jgi:hypothetical protein